MSTPDVVHEFQELAAHYDVDAARALELLSPWMRRYTEFVLADRNFEVIVGGKGREAAAAMAALSAEFGTPANVRDAFLGCAAEYPDVMLGLKVRFGSGAGDPSLYVRTMAPMEHGLAYLATVPEVAPALGGLREALAHSSVLYGLGFYSIGRRDFCLKTYTIGRVENKATTRRISATRMVTRSQGLGFISWRIWNGEVRREHKQYLPEMSLDELETRDSHWHEVIALAQRLGYGNVGHVGIERGGDSDAVFKLYVERIGAIPTDYSAR